MASGHDAGARLFWGGAVNCLNDRDPNPPREETSSGSDMVDRHSSSLDRPASARLIVPVVLSGGEGTRLWPYSTNETPKQFLPIVGTNSLFRETLDRVGDRRRFSAPIVVASARHAELCERELDGIAEGARLILEPCARNTAAAIALAAAEASRELGEGVLLLVMPSDHAIDDLPNFHDAVRVAEASAQAGYLVTFGIVPTYPDTGYGYIRTGDSLSVAAGAMDVASFVEKPDVERAEAMVADGRHLWNSGIFLFRADTFFDELETYAPDIAAGARRSVEAGVRDGFRVLPLAEEFEKCPSTSIDYAVMEHSSRVAVVPMSAGWSDLGSWDALADLVAGSEGEPVTLIDCENCYVRSDGLRVAALGVSDMIIVASKSGVLVLPRGRSQEVKALLAAIRGSDS